MNVMTIFAIQFLMSIVVWGSLAYWLLAPRLEKKSLNEALFFLTVPHAFRHIGMVFLVPGVVAGPLVFRNYSYIQKSLTNLHAPAKL